MKPYKAKALPEGLQDRLAEDGWIDEALRAIEHLPRCRFFRTPATMFQIVKPGFVAKVLAGQFDEREPARAATPRDDRPPPRVWSGADEAARLAALKTIREAAG